jgi:hypothetical protein
MLGYNDLRRVEPRSLHRKCGRTDLNAVNQRHFQNFQFSVQRDSRNSKAAIEVITDLLASKPANRVVDRRAVANLTAN